MKMNLLNQLLHGVHDVNMIMMSLDHLRRLLGGTHSVEDLQMKSDHLNNIHSQILRFFFHVIEKETMNVVEKDMHFHVY